MDQTHISILPEPRYGAFGGIYPSYEYSNEYKTNLYLAHGRSEFSMNDNMYVYSFTDLRGLNGVWEKSIYLLLKKKTKPNIVFLFI